MNNVFEEFYSLEELKNIPGGEVVLKIFEPLLEDWMIEKDIIEIIRESLEESKETVASINEKVNIGIVNGYSLEQQIEIIQKMCKD